MLEVTYNYYLVGLSFAIAVFGSFTALQLAIRIPSTNGAEMWLWIISAGLALGGGAIWSMHFIGMLAYNTPMEMTYDFTLTVASLLIATVVACIGLFIVGHGKFTVFKLLFAGVAGGLGVCAMHYTGMEAMIMPADIVYDPKIVALSFVIAIVAATAALWLAFNLNGNLQRFGSAFVMGVAVCGMHYTAMSGVSLVPNGGAMVPSSVFSPETTALVIFVSAFVVLMLLLIVVFAQAHSTKMIDEMGLQ